MSNALASLRSRRLRRTAPLSLTAIGSGVFLFLALLWPGCATAPGPSKEKAYHYFSAGAYHDERGNRREAIQAYRQALRYDPNAVEIWITLAESYYDDNQFQASGEAARQALQRESLSIEARIVLANSYLGQGRTRLSEAMREYERAAKLAPERWDILYTLSNLYEVRGDYKSAADRLNRILVLRPEAMDIKGKMAGLLVKSGALDKAEEVYAGMLLEDSLSLDGHLGLGFVYELKHEFEAAAAEYEAALALRPASTNLKRRLMNVYQNSGAPDRALAMCREILASDSTDQGARGVLGIMLYEMKRYPEAGETFQALLGKNPRDPSAHYYLGRIAYDRKDYAAAQAEMVQVTRLAPKQSSAWVYLGLLQVRGGNEKQALQSLRKSLPPGAEAKGGLDYLLGYACAEAGLYRRALAAYQQALKLNAQDPRTFYGIGVAYDKLGQLDSAVAAFRKVIELDSLDASSYNYIGYLYADKGIRLEESLELVKKALALDPDNGYFLDSKAWAFFKQGRYEEAEREQERACALVKDDAVLLDHLGDIYRARGKAKEARAAWQRALELDPGNEGIKKKLQGGP